MMKLDFDGLRQLYRMNNMIRYNPWAKINNETVAAHSYYTALFTLIICEELNLDESIKGTAMTIALLHDTPESVTNDITYDAKKVMPQLDEILLPFEKKFIKDNFPFAYNSMFGVETEERNVARTIVKVADIISVIQYCDNEVQLGNIRFHKLLKEANKRLEEQKQKLEGMGFECQKIINYNL